MDWVGHHVDIANWGMDWDSTGPTEIEGEGKYPPRESLWNTATKYKVTAKYSGGVEMIIAGGYKEIRNGTKWIGDEGWIWVDRSGLEAHPKNLLKSEIGPNDIQIPKSIGHYEEFIESVKTRKETLTPARVSIRSATPGWLGQIAMLTKRKRQMRAPWKL